LAAEEAAAPAKAKAAPKAGGKKKAAADKPSGGIVASSFSINDPLGLRKDPGAEDQPVAEVSATGVEDMLEALELVNQKTDKDAMGAKVSERTEWRDAIRGQAKCIPGRAH
jgi:hypothetical protein